MHLCFRRRWALVALPCVLLCAAAGVACNRAEPGKAAALQASPGTAAGQDAAAGDVQPGSLPVPAPEATASNAGNVAGPDTSAASLAVNDGGAKPPDQKTETAPIVPVTANKAAGQVEAVQSSIHIETVPQLPSQGIEPAEAVSPQVADRPFVKLQLPAAANAQEWLAFLGECDRAVQDLTIVRQSGGIGEKEFIQHARRLSGLKLEAGERLYRDPNADAAMRKTAIAARVESLSQLSGLGDVEAAKKLLVIADQLIQSNDAQLAHQGRLVLLGFRLNQLLEGQLKDPQAIIDDMTQMLTRDAERGLVEMLALQQCAAVLSQLGYKEHAQQVTDRIVREYKSSDDKELAMRAWGIEVNNTQALLALHESHQRWKSGGDARQVVPAAEELIRAYPSLQSLAYLSRFLNDLEFNGQVAEANQLAAAISKAKAALPAGPLAADIDLALDGHAQRQQLLGKPLKLEQLEGLDGRAFDWSQYRGKVVLVYFWTSWDIVSLERISQFEKLRGQFGDVQFDLVGICLDEPQTMSSAEQLVLRKALPWRNVRSSDPIAVSFNGRVARQMGVTAPHYAVLVDKAGIVRALHPGMDKLPAMIEQLRDSQ